MIELQHAALGRDSFAVVEIPRDSSRDLDRLLAAPIRAGQLDLVVDLGDRCDAPSDLLLVLYRTASHVCSFGGTLRVVAAQPSVRRLFDLTLLSRTLPIFASRDEALRAGGC